MIHARPDYDRFQDPLNKIPEDEPVMLFRAQDVHFIKVLETYAADLYTSNNKEMHDVIMKHVKLANEWRAKNDVKEPDL